MVVGLCTIDIQVPDSASLKQKRHVVKSVIARVGQSFNVSIAEVDHQDSWQLATLAVACVSADARYAQGLLERVVRYIELERFDLILLDYHTELI